jgi:two-component sensor histidine kinase
MRVTRALSGAAVERTGPPAPAGERHVAWRTLYVLAIAALAALVPLILFAGLWLREELAQDQRELEAYLGDRVLALSTAVDGGMREGLGTLSTLAALPSLDGPDLPAFEAQAVRLVAAGPRWSALLVAGAGDGRIVAEPVREATNGAPALAAPEVVRSVAQSRRPAIRVLPAAAGRPEAMVALYAPAVRSDGVSHVLVAGLSASFVQDIVSAGASSDVFTVMLDEGGRMLARSRAGPVGEPASADLREAIDNRDEGVFAARTLEGQDVFTGFRRSPLTGWVAVAALDRGRFAALSQRSNAATLGTGLLSLTLAAVLAIVLSYNVVQRRVSEERIAASRSLSELDARLLATTQDALAEQRKAATEREVLLREIYHRVKNNLQIVQSLLRLGARGLSPEQQEPFEAAVRRIGAMSRVHTLLYDSPDLASVDLRDYLAGLAGEVAESYDAPERGIDLALDAEPMRVSLDTAVPLAFIAVELLTNAFRHAYPGGRRGTVTVCSRREGERGLLEVSDDGVGLPPDAGERRSLGLTIVRQLVRQIEGELTLPPAGGSTIRVTFPLAPPPAAPLPGR